MRGSLRTMHTSFRLTASSFCSLVTSSSLSMAMCHLNLRRACELLIISAFCVGQSQSFYPPVNGSLGQSVSLSVEVPNNTTVSEVSWTQSSTKTKIVGLARGSIEYFGSEEYKKRIYFHPGNFSLQISDLRREDTGQYEVTVTVTSGKQKIETVQLDVYEAVTGTNVNIGNITNCNVTLRCSVNAGSNVSFTWWRGQEALGNELTHRVFENGESSQLLFTAEPNERAVRCEASNPVSHKTAEIKLEDVCKGSVSDFSTYLPYVAPIVVILFLCLVCYVLKRQVPLWKTSLHDEGKF
ncbi:SLAM family member 5-like isoform X1 [Stegostoma tigrinum]|uniref:SLAM family member 5-like isoform X1 n=3 Tax=Stegostoma tigrinum TaxID=3053191 RepID=UPI00287074BE|nr:SLAM family member 5-like isoform X1 [Stegostoma tigrinum]XP_059498847.1 SLAM family member 5-like isoform X1 [Stegostoma tigrinum]